MRRLAEMRFGLVLILAMLVWGCSEEGDTIIQTEIGPQNLIFTNIQPGDTIPHTFTVEMAYPGEWYIDQVRILSHPTGYMVGNMSVYDIGDFSLGVLATEIVNPYVDSTLVYKKILLMAETYRWDWDAEGNQRYRYSHRGQQVNVYWKLGDSNDQQTNSRENLYVVRQFGHLQLKSKP